MRLRHLAVVGLMVIGVVWPSSVLATPGFSTSEVLGNITNCSENLAFIPVTVTCGSETLTGQTGSTNGDLGKYSLTFNNPGCQEGDMANVSALVNGNTYHGSGVIGTFFFFWDKANVNIDTGVNCVPPGVPEFGVIPGIIAGLTSAYGFWKLRRKKIPIDKV